MDEVRFWNVARTQQEIREIERAGLRLAQLGEHLGCREELVAMRTRQALDAFLFEHRIECPACTAVGVDHENLAVTVAMGADLCTHRRRDALGAVVQLRRQTAHIDRLPAVGAAQRRDLTSEGAAGDQQDVPRRVHRR